MFKAFLVVYTVWALRVIEWSTTDFIFYRELRGTGLKQELYTELKIFNGKSCVLFENIGKDWFIDIEEVPKFPKFEFNSKIDIEIPAALSVSHNFSIFIPNSLKFVFPLHLRYNDCSDQEYLEISLASPMIQCAETEYKVDKKITALMPVGNLQDLNKVTIITTVTVVISVFWIISSIHTFNKGGN